MSAPTVSVIIATYNYTEALREAFASLFGQTFTDLEVWVVGDACTAQTAAVVEELADGRVQYYNRASNSGSQALPNNDGFDRSRGRFIAYLNHDDLWFPWHLELLVQALEQTGAGYAFDYYARRDRDAVLSVVGPPPRGVSPGDHLVVPSAWLVRRTLLEQVGPWPDADRVAEGIDQAMLRRFHRAGAAFTCVPRLGTLHFPSPFTAAYAVPDARPQREWRERIAADPEAAERDVLYDLARLQAGSPPPAPTLAKSLRYYLGRARRWLEERYGRERWPLAAWRVRRFQAYRRRARARRGLPPQTVRGRQSETTVADTPPGPGLGGG